MTTWIHTSGQSHAGAATPTWTHTSNQSDVSNPKWTDIVWNQGSILTWSIHFGGSGDDINDIVRLTLNGDTLASATVTSGTISNGRVITGLTFTSLGDDYLTDELCETTTNSSGGSGCIIKVLSVTNTYGSASLSSTWTTTS